jgi:hypothetical protein
MRRTDGVILITFCRDVNVLKETEALPKQQQRVKTLTSACWSKHVPRRLVTGCKVHSIALTCRRTAGPRRWGVATHCGRSHWQSMRSKARPHCHRRDSASCRSRATHAAGMTLCSSGLTTSTASVCEGCPSQTSSWTQVSVGRPACPEQLAGRSEWFHPPGLSHRRGGLHPFRSAIRPRNRSAPPPPRTA